MDMASIEEVKGLRADARRNRDSVLAAASRLFAQDGVEVQMPDIAKAANVGVGTVYRHFPCKEHLIAALLTERFERLGEKARECVEYEDSWEAVADFIRFSARIQREDLGLTDIIGLRPDLAGAAAAAAGLPALAEQLVTRAQRDGKLRADLSWEDIPMITCG